MDDESDVNWLVDKILPSREVHLICGPSGSGKSTWIWQFIESWQRGEEIFGYASHPQPFVYISLDRGKRAVGRAFERYEIDPAKCGFPFLTTDNLDLHTLTIDSFFKAVREKASDARVWFVEGFAFLAPSGKTANDYQAVAKFLRTVQQKCEKHGITIFGVVHSPKMKETEQYTNPRQRILGSVAWAAYTETIILIEHLYEKGKPLSPARELYILPRNSREELHHMAFGEDGMLYETLTTADYPELLRWAQKFPLGQPFSSADIVAFGATINLSRPTVFRWLKAMCENGIIERSQRGSYVVVLPM